MIKAKQMRRMGFTDHRPEFWYYTTRVLEDVSFNVRINKETWEIETDILNENFLQPEYYGRMREPYRSAIKWNIDVILDGFKEKGLIIPYNHKEYGWQG